MAWWKYDLGECGANLHAEIDASGEDDESCLVVLNALRDCYARIKELIPAEDYENDFEEMAEELDIVRSGIEYGDDDDPVSSTDYALSVFYDLCDANRIWVAL